MPARGDRTLRIGADVSSAAGIRRISDMLRAQNDAATRLTTGLRVVRARDDPAALIASELARSDLARLRGRAVAFERTDSIANVAESALAEISDLLVEAEALAVQLASRDGTSQSEVQGIAEQLGSMLNTIDRIGHTTTFSRSRLFDGRFTLAADDASLTLPEISSQALGLRGLDLDNARGVADAVRAAARRVSDARGKIGGLQKWTLTPLVRAEGVRLENTAAAESIIRDADFGRETAELVRAQILAQASITAVLASRGQTQTALSLLLAR
ncbi:MAG: flagellin [Planctomycetota bacterium]|nr:flagellin [Planctomycetota bacterium]